MRSRSFGTDWLLATVAFAAASCSPTSRLGGGDGPADVTGPSDAQPSEAAANNDAGDGCPADPAAVRGGYACGGISFAGTYLGKTCPNGVAGDGGGGTCTCEAMANNTDEWVVVDRVIRT